MQSSAGAQVTPSPKLSIKSSASKQPASITVVGPSLNSVGEPSQCRQEAPSTGASPAGTAKWMGVGDGRNMVFSRSLMRLKQSGRSVVRVRLW